MTSLTIRLGAAHWDATLADGTRFDFRKMTLDQRKQWYGAFMSSVRRVYGRPEQPAPRPKSGRKGGRG